MLNYKIRLMMNKCPFKKSISFKEKKKINHKTFRRMRKNMSSYDLYFYLI